MIFVSLDVSGSCSSELHFCHIFFFLDKIQVNPKATKLVQLQSLESCIPLRPSKLHSFGYSVTSDNHYRGLHLKITKKHIVFYLQFRLRVRKALWPLRGQPLWFGNTVFVGLVHDQKYRKKSIDTAASGQHWSARVPLQCNLPRHKASSSPAM